MNASLTCPCCGAEIDVRLIAAVKVKPRLVGMKKKDAIEFFGGQHKLANALRISQQAISQWPEDVPEPRNYQIQVLTNGVLRARDTQPEETAA